MGAASSSAKCGCSMHTPPGFCTAEELGGEAVLQVSAGVRAHSLVSFQNGREATPEAG